MSKRIGMVLAALAVVFVALVGSSAQAQDAPRVHKVVIAITSGDVADWNMTVANITHLIEGLKPDTTEVEVVAYGGGLNMILNGSASAEGVAALEKENVKFMACMNSMRARHVEAKDLLPGVGMVPSGIIEVVKKQEAGWAYIKGGK